MSSASSNAQKKRRPAKRFVNLVGRSVFWWFSLTSRLMRPWSIRLLGNALGRAFFHLSRRYRTISVRNLLLCFDGQMDEAAARRTSIQVFQNFTRAALEFFYVQSLSLEKTASLIDLDGRERIDAALAKGSGCILLTAHLGNWEILARKLVHLGYRVNAIARDSDDPGMTGIAAKIRESGGYNIFGRDQSMIGAFRCLKRNELLALLPDQNDWHGEFVLFFARPAATATGVAALSLKSGAPIVPIFAPRMADGRYRATAYPALDFAPSGDYEQDLISLTALFTARIEEEIRKEPAQWLWLHDRWRCTPEVRANAGKD